MPKAHAPATTFRIPLHLKAESIKVANAFGFSLNAFIVRFLENITANPPTTLEITRNGFTPEFEARVLAASARKDQHHEATPEEFINMLKSKMKKN